MTARIEHHEIHFEIEPIRNVVGIGSMAAFQVHVTRGRVIASQGRLDEFVNDSPANASCHDLTARNSHP